MVASPPLALHCPLRFRVWGHKRAISSPSYSLSLAVLLFLPIFSPLPFWPSISPRHLVEAYERQSDRNERPWHVPHENPWLWVKCIWSLGIRLLIARKVELGATEAVQQHLSRHVVATKPVSQRKLDFEHRRPRIMRECMAEATGVFYYVYAMLDRRPQLWLPLNLLQFPRYCCNCILHP